MSPTTSFFELIGGLRALPRKFGAIDSAVWRPGRNQNAQVSASALATSRAITGCQPAVYSGCGLEFFERHGRCLTNQNRLAAQTLQPFDDVCGLPTLPLNRSNWVCGGASAMANS